MSNEFANINWNDKVQKTIIENMVKNKYLNYSEFTADLDKAKECFRTKSVTNLCVTHGANASNVSQMEIIEQILETEKMFYYQSQVSKNGIQLKETSLVEVGKNLEICITLFEEITQLKKELDQVILSQQNQQNQ